MLLGKFKTYKKTYLEYVIFIKSGSFYICLNDDAFILSNVCKYKVKKSTNFIRCGFPANIINKVLRYFDYYNINYVVVDTDVSFKQKFTENNYLKFLKKSKNINESLIRINRINNILINNIDNIEDILDKIDGMLCKIDC